MDKPVTFSAYYGRFFRRLCKEAISWVRDNFIIAGGIALVPPVFAYWRDRGHPIDWEVVTTTSWMYIAVFAVYVICHIVGTAWKLDNERAETVSQANARTASLTVKVEELERTYLDDRPRLGMRVVHLSGEPQRGAPLDVEFRFCHLRGRPATSLSVDSIHSLGGRFTLHLGTLSYLARAADCPVSFEVFENGQRPFRKVVDVLGWGEVLKLFIWDSRTEGGEVAFPVIVRFSDDGDYREQRFRLIFNHTNYRFSVMDEFQNYVQP